MRYFYCGYCGELFREDAASEKVREDGRTYYACPNCGDLEIYDADSCKICGEPIVPYGVGVCAECAETLHKAWVSFVEKVMDRRLKENNGMSADFLDCEQAALDFLDEVGII